MKHKNYLKYTLLFSCIFSVNTVIADDIIKPYSITISNESDYSFNILNKNGTITYYKINLHPNNFTSSDNIIWSTTNSNLENSIIVQLPNGENKTLYFEYQQPQKYIVETDNLQNITPSNSQNRVFTVESNNSAINNLQDIDYEIKSDFINNKVLTASKIQGGALNNRGTIHKINGDFIKNEISFNPQNMDYTNSQNYGCEGGAIYNSGTINNITGDFILNISKKPITLIDGPYGSGGAIYNTGHIDNLMSSFINNESYLGGAIYNNFGEINTISGNFINNIGWTLGGAVYNYAKDNKNAIIDNIIGDFIGNSSTGGGGAIYNITTYSTNTSPQGAKAEISNITGDFIGNFSSTIYGANGGAIHNETTSPVRSAVLNNITGHFINNYIYITPEHKYNDSAGGAISNKGTTTQWGGSGILTSLNGNFINNYILSDANVNLKGGAIYNYNGQINDIKGDFISNHIKTKSGKVQGGAIYFDNYSTYGKLNIINNKFIGNYAVTNNSVAQGGAIYTNNDLTISANNGTSEFSGNYISADNGLTKDYQAVFVDSNLKTLTLQSKNNGIITFNDKISGIKGYKVNIDGDTTSKVELNNIIENAKINLNNTNLYLANNTLSDKNTSTSINNGTVHFENGIIENYNINKLTSNESANYIIDIDNSNKLAPIPDKIITGAGSSGIIKISDINLKNKENGFNTQILDAKDNNIQLKLSDEVKEKFNKTSIEKLYTSDNMKANINWQDKFHAYEQTKTTTSELRLDTTNTINDSIAYSQDVDLGEIVDAGILGNTLTLINQYETNEERNFNFDSENDIYKVTENLGPTAAGTLNINGNSTEEKRSTIDGNSLALFVLNNETKLNINNTKITGANSVVTGSNKNAIVTLNNVEISNNSSGITTAGSIIVKGNSKLYNNDTGLKVTSKDSVITLDATAGEITLNDNISGINGAKLNLQNGKINIGNKVSTLDTTISNAEVNMLSDNLFNGLNITVDNESLVNMSNNKTDIMRINNFILKDNMNLNVDVDLANKSMDRIQANKYDLENYYINVTRMNLLSDAKNPITKILFADSFLKNNVKTSVSQVAYSPIWKYAVNYDKTTGQFVFSRNDSLGNNTGTNVDAYNPAVLASPVAAQVGGYMSMLDTYQNAFTHMDMNMLKPLATRTTEMNANKYAISDNTPIAYNSNEMNSSGIWLKPYAGYDSVNLKNGPKVNNRSYGSFIGGDTSVHQFKNGVHGVFSPYIAYQGSHQSYSGNHIYQNGGTLGFTGSLHKGNFFTGLTAAIGANVAEASTMYGHDDFGMIMTGVATKTGYNFEFENGRFILQPSLMLSYTMVDSFNYTNAAGVNIHSDPLHVLQISPQMRFVMNTKNGWQPYLTAGMNWNLLDETNVTANVASLPDMSIKPYVQYGVGVQKTMKDRLTGFLQIVLRNGGRNGIAATGGLRYIFGKNKNSKQRV